MKWQLPVLVLVLALGLPHTAEAAALIYVKGCDSAVSRQFDPIALRTPQFDTNGRPLVGLKECWNLPPGSGGTLMCILVRDKYDDPNFEYIAAPCNNPYFYRRFKLDWRLVPDDLKRRLWYRGGIITNWSTIRRYFYDKVTRRHGGWWGPQDVYQRCRP